MEKLKNLGVKDDLCHEFQVNLVQFAILQAGFAGTFFYRKEGRKIFIKAGTNSWLKLIKENI